MLGKRRSSDDGTLMDIDMPVYEVAQEKLVNGTVSKSVSEKLEEEYGTEWKKEESASKIYMIPMVFTDKGTKNSKNGRDAERAMFNALEKINEKVSRVTDYLNKSTTMFGFVFHDQIFDDEEIDFVYVSIYGVVVVECKGIKKKTQANSEYESACDQLKRKVERIEKIVGSLGLPSNIPIFKVVSFAILSRCDIEIVGEIHVLFKEDLNDLKTWLRRKGFLLPKNVIHFDNYVKIASAFLIKYHTNGTGQFKLGREFKKRAISDCNDKLERTSKTFYTRKQAELLKVHHYNDLWVTGAAGTGKTLVLKDRVKLLTEFYPDEEEKVNIILVITYNVPINVDIELWVKTNTKCDGKLVRVQTFSALLGHIIRVLQGDNEQLKKVQRMEKDEDKIDYILENKLLDKYARSMYTHTPKYHHILVDEAQDLPGKWLKLLDGILRKDAKSNIWIFEDPFQVVRRSTTIPESESARFEKHSLTKVFRNTHNVFEAYQHCRETLCDQVTEIEKSLSDKALSPPTIEHNVYGLSPEYIPRESNDQLKDSLVSTLRRLQREGVVFLDVAVITSGNEVCNDVRKYLETAGIKCENAQKAIKLKYSKQNKADPPIIVDSYQRFKGLESKVLIFFIPRVWTPQDVDIYVGFSRSFCHLIVIGTSRMIGDIKKRQHDSMQRNA